MDEAKGYALVLFAGCMAMLIMQGRTLARAQREIDLIVKGDLETLKLKRKLDGYPENED